MTDPGRLVRLGLLAIGLVPAHVQAQTAVPATAARGYIEAVAQSAFGNVTSQSYGVEGGADVWRDLQVWIEVGRTKNAATPLFSSDAQKIAGQLATVQTAAVTYSAREPVTFVAGGLRCPIKIEGSTIEPYVMGGFGMGKVTKNVTYQLGGADATVSTLAPYVTLGTDLSGAFTKPMIVLGGGVVWPVWRQVIVDFQYRFGRVSAEDPGTPPPPNPPTAININRAGIGLGVRF